MPKKHNAGGCGCCDKCERCPGQTPLNIKAYINNVVNDTCTYCEDYNTLVINLTRNSTTFCQWDGETDPICDNTDYWKLELLEIDGDYVVRMTRNCGDSEIYWEATVDPLTDCCEDLHGLELLYTGEAINDCDWSYSQITLDVDCAGDVECSYCGIGAQYTPQFVSVTLSDNFSTYGCPQDTCDALASTYVCQYNGGSSCSWSSGRYTIPCSAGSIDVIVTVTITSTTLGVVATIYATGSGTPSSSFGYSKSYSAGGCIDWIAESVPYTTTIGLGAPCVIYSGDAKITTL